MVQLLKGGYEIFQGTYISNYSSYSGDELEPQRRTNTVVLEQLLGIVCPTVQSMALVQ